MGVANVGGEVMFEAPYESNCLVNAMCVGVLPVERIQSAAAAGAGNLVVLYGARTGRDGIGGASVLASQGFDEGSGAKRPSVQVGDPFAGKKLIECTLALLDAQLVVSLQDLGAAGLASSTAEMASSGGVGLDIDLRQGAAARGRHGGVRDHDLGVAGAHGGHRHARRGWTRSWRSAPTGTSTRR